MNDNEKKLNEYEKEIADQVADEILTVEEDDDRRYFILLLLFLICLIFLVSTLSFAIFDNYYNGGVNNVIKVGTDVTIDEKDKVKDVDKNTNKSYSNISKKKSLFHSKNIVDEPGSILFTYSEKSNYIDMYNVFPTSDEVGKKLTGDKQYFDFNISSKVVDQKKGKMYYEISLIPLLGNTIDEKDIRVYLIEDGKEVSINDNVVNNFSDLPKSKFHSGARIIYKKALTNDYNGNYVFRMWYSYNAEVTKVSKRFGCKVAVDAFYK